MVEHGALLIRGLSLCLTLWGCHKTERPNVILLSANSTNYLEQPTSCQLAGPKLIRTK